jgi:hypothetical protein
MRSRSSLALAALVLLLPALASAASRPELVIRVGGTATTVHEDDLYSDAREGLAVGVGSLLEIGKGWALLPEIWYQQKGFKSGTLWEQIHLEQKTSVITVPVLLSYLFPARRLVSRVYGGLAVDVLLTSETRERREDWVDVKDHDESVSLGLVLGGGTHIGWLDLDIRYQHGVTRTTNFDYPQFRDVVSVNQEFDDAFDRTWTLSAGFWF